MKVIKYMYIVQNLSLSYCLDYETLAYVHLEDYHYSAVEGSCFEACVVAVNHSPEELTFTACVDSY